MVKTFASVLVAGIAFATFTGNASAQGRRHVAQDYDAPSSTSLPLTVNRRSWLDPGPVAPKGTGNNYVTMNTAEFSKSQIDIQRPDDFGKDALPGQPYVPGRSVPVVEFSTTPNGRVDVDRDTLAFQNFYFNPAPSEP